MIGWVFLSRCTALGCFEASVPLWFGRWPLLVGGMVWKLQDLGAGVGPCNGLNCDLPPNCYIRP